MTDGVDRSWLDQLRQAVAKWPKVEHRFDRTTWTHCGVWHGKDCDCEAGQINDARDTARSLAGLEVDDE